jgi:hypothetical protein
MFREVYGNAFLTPDFFSIPAFLISKRQWVSISVFFLNGQRFLNQFVKFFNNFFLVIQLCAGYLRCENQFAFRINTVFEF